MSQFYWVIDVLHDIGKFADVQGFQRLGKSIDQATEALLDDLRAHHEAGFSRSKPTTRENRELDLVEEAVISFRPKPPRNRSR